MASFVYHRALAKLLSGAMDLDTHDMRVLLVMSNTTADTETDAEFIDDFTTLDEMNGANYARQALTGETVTADLTNDRGEFDSDDTTFTALGNGTRPVVGAVILRHVTDDTDSIPFAFIDLEDFNPGGQNFVLQWNSESIVQIRNAP